MTGRYLYYRALTLLGYRWRWQFRARNGEIVAHGEGYQHKTDCLHAIALLQGSAGCPVDERP